MLEYIRAAGWIGALILLAALGGGFRKVGLLYLTESGVSIDRAEGWFAYGVIAAIILLPAFFTGRRAFCRYLCPWIILDMVVLAIKTRLRLPSLHLKADSSACIGCGLCDRNCPMILPCAGHGSFRKPASS